MRGEVATKFVLLSDPPTSDRNGVNFRADHVNAYTCPIVFFLRYSDFL